jgi:hypothetical protein
VQATHHHYREEDDKKTPKNKIGSTEKCHNMEQKCITHMQSIDENRKDSYEKQQHKEQILLLSQREGNICMTNTRGCLGDALMRKSREINLDPVKRGTL